MAARPLFILVKESPLTTMPCLEGEVILGVDTHRDTHAAALIDSVGQFIAAETFPRAGAVSAPSSSGAASAAPFVGLALRAPAATVQP